MQVPQTKIPHIVFLFSDTGGGHRSAVEAILEAMSMAFPGKMTAEMVDIFKDYAPVPLNQAPTIYPPLSRMPEMWGLGYRLSDGKYRTRAFSNMIWPYIRQSTHRLVKENKCNLFVSVHPLSNTPVLKAMRRDHRPFMTVVTDMVSTHAFWYDNRSDLVVVATEEAKERGVAYGVDPEKIRVVGLPVAQRFCNPPSDKAALRERLGWPKDLPVILLVGGGEGMGPIEKIARAIDESGLQAGMAIVCGRNAKLKTTLETYSWRNPVSIYGFTRDMPDFMAAADMLVTKAGPGTISEAFIAGLPIIIYSRMPGQEDGNVFYTVNHNAGIWAPHPERVVAAIREWIDDPVKHQQVVDACHAIAKPDAALQIAKIIAEQVGVKR
ncbi:MAG: galactosyldiacylglycerol synthase [Anaerolinea sp.]|nr:galactosyldiacylglycerol synthase [Anaerolinea sp.]